MKEPNNDKLAGLFRKMPLDNPPEGFDSRLMEKIAGLAAEKQSRKARHTQTLRTWTLAAGIAAIIAVPAIILFVLGFTFDASKIPSLDIPIAVGGNSVFGLIAVAVLMLTVTDTLLRRHMNNKHKR